MCNGVERTYSQVALAIGFGILSLCATATADEAKDALRALQALRSATEVGMTYRQYSDRVVDAKVKVDAYRRTALGTSPLPGMTGAIDAAMRHYQAVLPLWEAKVRRENPETALDRLARTQGLCPRLYALLNRNEDEWREHLNQTPEGSRHWDDIRRDEAQVQRLHEETRRMAEQNRAMARRLGVEHLVPPSEPYTPGRQVRYRLRQLAFQISFSTLWQCAAEHIAEAEGLLR